MDNFLSNLQTYIGNNSLFAYPLVFLGGVLISFTACVYPVIPIVVGFIGASSSSSLKRSFLLSLAYVLGLSLVYAGLGALASLTGFFLGQITSSPWTYFILGNIFIFLGISALGFYDMPFMGLKKTSVDKPRNYGGSFLVGAASGFVIGPCTAPALGVILSYVATRKSIIFGVTLLFTFALGMSLLLLCLGTFSSLIKKIPKTGKFNMVVEKIFGVILLGTGEVFLVMAGKRFV